MALDNSIKQPSIRVAASVVNASLKDALETAKTLINDSTVLISNDIIPKIHLSVVSLTYQTESQLFVMPIFIDDKGLAKGAPELVEEGTETLAPANTADKYAMPELTKYYGKGAIILTPSYEVIDNATQAIIDGYEMIQVVAKNQTIINELIDPSVEVTKSVKFIPELNQIEVKLINANAAENTYNTKVNELRAVWAVSQIEAGGKLYHEMVLQSSNGITFAEIFLAVAHVPTEYIEQYLQISKVDLSIFGNLPFEGVVAAIDVKSFSNIAPIGKVIANAYNDKEAEQALIADVGRTFNADFSKLDKTFIFQSILGYGSVHAKGNSFPIENFTLAQFKAASKDGSITKLYNQGTFKSYMEVLTKMNLQTSIVGSISRLTFSTAFINPLKIAVAAMYQVADPKRTETYNAYDQVDFSLGVIANAAGVSTSGTSASNPRGGQFIMN